MDEPRRRPHVPVPLVPVVAGARLAARGRRRRLDKKAKAAQRTLAETQQAQVVEATVRALGGAQRPAVASPGQAVAVRPRADVVHAERMAARADELALVESWWHQNRKWLVAIKVALLLGASRGLIHVPTLPTRYALLAITLLSFLALGTAFLSRQVGGALAILAVLAGVASSPYLPLAGLVIAAPLLIGACFWLPQVSWRPALKDQQHRAANVQPPKLHALVCALLRLARWLSRPILGAVLTAIAAGWWWASSLEWQPAYITLGCCTLLVTVARAIRFQVREVIEGEVVYHPSHEDDWYEHIAAKKPTAQGTYVQSVEEVASEALGAPIGFALVIVWPQGSDGAATVVNGLRGAVSTTYDVGPADVMWELHPKKARIARLTVLTNAAGNALEATLAWDGETDFVPALAPGVDHTLVGTFTHSMRGDWTPTLLQLYAVGEDGYYKGAFHSHFSGGTGGGKTRGMDLFVRKVTQHNVVAPCFIDLGGADFVPWEPYAPVFIGKREGAEDDDPDELEMLSALAAVQFLKNLHAEVQRRQKDLGALRRIDPKIEALPVDADRPVILTVFEEWQFAWTNNESKPPARFLAITDGLPIKDAILKYTKLIMTQGRKVNVVLLIAGQEIGLTEGFGNVKSIRSQAQQGNMVAYRSSTEAGAQAFGGELVVDPSTIPRGGGLNFTTSPVQAVDAMNRGFWVRAPHSERIRIPGLSAETLATLTRNLVGGQLDLEAFPEPEPGTLPGAYVPGSLQVPAYPIIPAQPTGEPDDVAEPAQPAGWPALVAVPTPPSVKLRNAMRAWLATRESQGERTRRGDFITYFAGEMVMASKTKVDQALADLKAEQVFEADPSGYYATIKQEVA